MEGNKKSTFKDLYEVATNLEHTTNDEECLFMLMKQGTKTTALLNADNTGTVVVMFAKLFCANPQIKGIVLTALQMDDEMGTEIRNHVNVEEVKKEKKDDEE